MPARSVSLFSGASLSASQAILRERLKQPGIFLGLLGMGKIQVLAMCCLMISDIEKKEDTFFISLLTISPQEEFCCCLFF